MEAERKDTIRIYSTNKGVNVVHSPIKAKILSLLKYKGLSGSEIVSKTGKSKSTISAHLQDLVDADIIDWESDPQDRRRKIFYIKSRYLGDLSSEKELENDTDHYLDSEVLKSNDPFRFFRYMFRTIRVALLKEGVNIDPILHHAGIKVGENFYPELKAKSPEEFQRNLISFWEDNHLGKLEIYNQDPLVVQAQDCFECEDLPQLGRPACAFDSGILEAFFSQFFGEKMEVEETNCYAQGDMCCRFIVTPPKMR